MVITVNRESFAGVNFHGIHSMWTLHFKDDVENNRNKIQYVTC